MNEPLNPDENSSNDTAPEQGLNHRAPEQGVLPFEPHEEPVSEESEPEVDDVETKPVDDVEPTQEEVVEPSPEAALEAELTEDALDEVAADIVVEDTPEVPPADTGEMVAEAAPEVNPEEAPELTAAVIPADVPEVLPEGFDPLAVDDPESIPPLDRKRPFRPPVIPLWVSYVSVALIVAIVASLAGFAWWSRSASVSTPVVVGMSEEEASQSIEALGLVMDVTERRFSTEPRGQVLEQNPTAGTTLRRGESVQLIVSAGTEEFPMPDVVGDGLASAQAALEERGLVVNVTTVESGEASDTVLASVPGPGESVRTGDVVRLTVSKPAPDGGGLKPYSLNGISVVIDAAPVANSATDPAMDVTRRLRALLEAAGATVVTTRSSTDPDTLTEVDRANRAKEASASVAIGLSVAETGAAGRVVQYPASGLPQVVSASARLSSVLTSALAQSAPPATSANAASDAVLSGTNVGWARIRLGSLTAREDQTAFADPTWADRVARVVYTAIGQLYGLEATAP